ncbi:hypothetical protein ABIE49_002628 [Bradyrhizobium sp. OAE829]
MRSAGITSDRNNTLVSGRRHPICIRDGGISRDALSPPPSSAHQEAASVGGLFRSSVALAPGTSEQPKAFSAGRTARSCSPDPCRKKKRPQHRGLGTLRPFPNDRFPPDGTSNADHATCSLGECGRRRTRTTWAKTRPSMSRTGSCRHCISPPVKAGRQLTVSASRHLGGVPEGSKGPIHSMTWVFSSVDREKMRAA